MSATDSDSTYVGVITRVLGAGASRSDALERIFDWAREADNAEDDDAELEALSGLASQIENVLKHGGVGEKFGTLGSLLGGLREVLADFNGREEAASGIAPEIRVHGAAALFDMTDDELERLARTIHADSLRE